MSDYWIPDNETYSHLQQLKSFVDFVAGLEYATVEDKQKVAKINSLIEHINEPDTFKSWNVCLDIFDRDLQTGTNKKGGIYWRKWTLYFEGNILEIEAKTEHTDEPINHYGKDFYFFGAVYFQKEISGKRIYLSGDLSDFIRDARNYRSYMTETLNDIEIDIDLF